MKQQYFDFSVENYPRKTDEKRYASLKLISDPRKAVETSSIFKNNFVGSNFLAQNVLFPNDYSLPKLDCLKFKVPQIF